MRVFVGILFFFVLSLIAAYFVYSLLIRQRSKTKRRVKPKAKVKARTSPKASLAKPRTQAASAQTQTRYRYELPPEIPRDINTIRIIAKEDPNIIIDIIRMWMRQR